MQEIHGGRGDHFVGLEQVVLADEEELGVGAERLGADGKADRECAERVRCHH